MKNRKTGEMYTNVEMGCRDAATEPDFEMESVAGIFKADGSKTRLIRQ